MIPAPSTTKSKNIKNLIQNKGKPYIYSEDKSSAIYLSFFSSLDSKECLSLNLSSIKL